MTREERIYEWMAGRGGRVVMIVGLVVLFAGMAYGLTR